MTTSVPSAPPAKAAPELRTRVSAETSPSARRTGEPLIGRAVQVAEFRSAVADATPCGLAGCGRLVADALVESLRARGVIAEVGAHDAHLTRAVQLDGDLIDLEDGNRAARYFLGFGAGATRVAIRARVRDSSGDRIAEFLVEKKRTSGKFGGSTPALLRATVRDVAEEVADRVATGRY